MNLENALHCLLLRQLRDERLKAESCGLTQLAARLVELANNIVVERDKNKKEYSISIVGTHLKWIVPDTEFTFYSRGDTMPPSRSNFLNLEDIAYEKNLANVNKWLIIFLKACDA